MLCLVPASVNEELLTCSSFDVSAIQCLNGESDRPGMLDNYILSVCLFRSNAGPYESKLRTAQGHSMPVCQALSPLQTGLANQL